MTSHVEEQIAARIAAAREKRQQRRQQRAELDAARIPGLAARHDAKMRRWAEEEDASMGRGPKAASVDLTDADVTETVTVAAPDRGVADLRGPDGHAGVTETVTVVEDGGDE